MAPAPRWSATGKQLLDAFSATAEYIRPLGEAEVGPSPADLSPELTRHFRALRLWLPLQMAGVAAFRAAQSEKLALARYFHARLSEIDGFDPGPAPDLSVVAFRYVPKDGDADAFNERLLQPSQQEGRVMLSGTRIDGSYYMRCAILCFRTHVEHVDDAIDAIVARRGGARWLRSLRKPSGCACATGTADDLRRVHAAHQHASGHALAGRRAGRGSGTRRHSSGSKAIERELRPHLLDRRAQVRRRTARLLRAQARQQRRAPLIPANSKWAGACARMPGGRAMPRKRRSRASTLPSAGSARRTWSRSRFTAERAEPGADEAARHDPPRGPGLRMRRHAAGAEPGDRLSDRRRRLARGAGRRAR